jgi:hypothetical protein
MKTLLILAASTAALVAFGQASSTGSDRMPDPPISRQQPAPAPEAMAASLKISYGDRTAEWTAPKLSELPHQTITLHNAHANADQTYSGVPLISLLTPLGVPEKPRGKDLALYLVAEGQDGYKVVFALGEAAPDVHDGTVLVADQVDGKPLTTNGPFQLVCTGEKRPARWVRNLVAIRVALAN